jgi:hypothetical protein
MIFKTQGFLIFKLVNGKKVAVFHGISTLGLDPKEKRTPKEALAEICEKLSDDTTVYSFDLRDTDLNIYGGEIR